MECLVSTFDGDEVSVEPEHFSVFTIIESENGSYYSGLTVPTGYRTYIEWMQNSTAASNASVAVTLPYDSSVMQEKETASYHIYGTSATPEDVISQIEGSTSYGDTNIYLFRKTEITDVNTSDKISVPGIIYNWQQETLGAKNDGNPGGYTPIFFTAPVTGVYTFRFF